MKNLKKVLISFVFLFVMIFSVSCSMTGGGNSSTYFLEQDGGKSTVVLFHNNNEVNKVKMDAEVNYEVMGIPTENIEQMKQTVSIAESALKSVKGFDLKFDFKDTMMTFNMTVDYSKVDMEQLKNLTKLSGDVLPFTNIDEFKNFEKAEKSLLNSGFVKK